MTNQPVPNPFECARRVVGINVLLKPEDIMCDPSITRQQAEQLLDRHASSIALRMLDAGRGAAVEIAKQEGVPE